MHDEDVCSQKPQAAMEETAPIGLTRGLVRLVPYNPVWECLFAAEAARLRVALGDRALQIEHVGSTAVAGLMAKPIEDWETAGADAG